MNSSSGFYYQQFLKIFAIFLSTNFLIFVFKFSENCYHVPSSWIFMSQGNYLEPEIGILDSLLKQ